VEECLSIDANRWAREGILKAGVRQVGGWQWTYRDGQTNSISYEVNTLHMGRPLLRLFYSRKGEGEPQQENYHLRLTTTRPRFGGLRWWFVCPLVVSGRACGRRVAKLYLPPGGRFFGCRHCHDLTYTSCQESHQNDGLYRFMAREMGWDFETAREALERLSERWRHGP
jgi:hypothetical protein